MPRAPALSHRGAVNIGIMTTRLPGRSRIGFAIFNADSDEDADGSREPLAIAGKLRSVWPAPFRQAR